jgi:hypothetical protein
MAGTPWPAGHVPEKARRQAGHRFARHPTALDHKTNLAASRRGEADTQISYQL